VEVMIVKEGKGKGNRLTEGKRSGSPQQYPASGRQIEAPIINSHCMMLLNAFQACPLSLYTQLKNHLDRSTYFQPTAA